MDLYVWDIWNFNLIVKTTQARSSLAVWGYINDFQINV